MISKKDSKPFLVKFVIANTLESEPKPIYSDYNCVSGLIGDPTGLVSKEPYGLEFDFDRLVTVNATPTTRKIAYNTAVLLEEYPTDNFPNGNYNVSKIFPEYNNEIVIGLKKIDGLDIPRLYYLYNGEVVTYQLNYDKTTNTGYIDKKQPIPFTTDSVIWTRKPSSVDQTTHKIAFVGSESVGIDNQHLHYHKLTFRNV